MLTAHRKQQLLSRLKQDGKLIAKDLSEELGVSKDTVRRDLRELAQEGLLLRVHGVPCLHRPRWVISPQGRKYGTTEDRD